MARWRRAWEETNIDRILVPGILAGMIAAIPMGLFVMIASGTYEDRGFYAPMYDITSLLGDETVARSVQEAASGNLFFLVAEPMLFGVAMHLMVGAFYGAIFAAVARVVPSRASTVLTGIVYGLLVMVLMSFIVVPVADAILEGSERLRSPPTTVGWGTFTLQHVIYGLVLGWWPWLRPQEARSRPSARADRRPQ